MDIDDTKAPQTALRIEELKIGDKVEYRMRGPGKWREYVVDEIIARSSPRAVLVTVNLVVDTFACLRYVEKASQITIDEGRLRRAQQPALTQAAYIAALKELDVAKLELQVAKSSLADSDREYDKKCAELANATDALKKLEGRIREIHRVTGQP